MKTLKKRQKKGIKQVCNKSNKVLDLCNTQVIVKGMNSDRLELLKTKCEQEIAEAEDKVRQLKAKLANLVALAAESEKLANPESEPDRYVNFGLTEAVFDAIQELWSARKKASSATEIKNYLLAHGFKAPENFETAVYTVLTRLHANGRIATINQGRPSLEGPPQRKLFRPMY